jgi:hypothetical protein
MALLRLSAPASLLLAVVLASGFVASCYAVPARIRRLSRDAPEQVACAAGLCAAPAAPVC